MIFEVKMNHNKPMSKARLLVFILTLFNLDPSWGAKIVLKEGKILQGKIVDEDEEKVTMVLGQNMVITVERDKIRELILDPKPSVPKTPTVTTESLQPDDTPLSASQTTEQKDKDEVVFNVKSNKLHRQSKKGEVQIFETLLFEPYYLKDEAYKAALGRIPDPKFPSKVKLTSSWNGAETSAGGQARWKSLVIQATMTITYPFWTAPLSAAQEDKVSWESYIKKVKVNDEDRIGIYARGLSSLGDALMAMQAANEADLKKKSQQLVTQELAKLEKRQQGYGRRHPITP